MGGMEGGLGRRVAESAGVALDNMLDFEAEQGAAP